MTDTHPKRVLVIESGEGVGGSAFSMFRIVKYLDKSSYEPFVFVYYRTAIFGKIEDLGIPVRRLPLVSLFPRNLMPDSSIGRRAVNFVSLYGNLLLETAINGIRLAYFIKRQSIDIVHCNNGFFENFAAAFAARITRTPCVSHVRGTEPIMRVERMFSSWVQKFIVLNPDMLEAYGKTFGREKVHLIYNGVDLDLFGMQDSSSFRDTYSISKDIFCVGTFARIVDGKGVPEFLEAAAIANKSRTDIRYFVVGGTEQDETFGSDMHSLAKSLDLTDVVVFTGWRDDVRDVMSAMNLIMQISTTYPEGMSLAPIEGMALSVPVIVSDNPGYANIVEHGRSGFVVPAGDVDELARLTIHLASDRSHADEIGRNGHQRVLDEFEYGIVVRRVEGVYEMLLSDDPQSNDSRQS